MRYSLGRYVAHVAVVLVGLAVSMISASAATFTVTNTSASGPGSLAQAIIDANASAGADMIAFNIPGGGVHTIDVSAIPLPDATDALTIDGYTQPGAHPNTLNVGSDAVILIQIDGGNAAQNQRDGIVLAAPNCVVRGLSLTGFAVGYTTTSFGSHVAAGGNAISVQAANCATEGNFIGLMPDGATARGNTIGITQSSNGTVIVGGAMPAQRNIISGNGTGVVIGPGALVVGNYIGCDATGTHAVGNYTGLLAHSFVTGAVIGGTSTAAANVISGNTGAAISIGYHDSHSDDVGGYLSVKGNLIGVQPDGSSPLPNGQAIWILLGTNNTIGGSEPGAGNTIAFNGKGVIVQGGYSNAILSNSIYANNGLGIDLAGDGASPNRPYDPTKGPNAAQNFPTFGAVTFTDDSVQIIGNLNSAPNASFVLQFFSESSDLVRPVQTYLGATTVKTDGNGNAGFIVQFPVADRTVSFNATATDSAGNTSEFTFAPAPLLNVSTRGRIGSGEDALIGGVIASGSSALLRGLGPSLASAGVTDALADPTLELFNAGQSEAFNDNWKDSQQTQIAATGLAPSNDLESAIVAPIFQNTFILRSKTDTPGIGLVEAYDVDSRKTTLLNISTRGRVSGGQDALIAGFIVGDGATTRIVARALGPSLANSGVAGALADPVVTLYDNNGTALASNDDWKDSQEAELQMVGLAPTVDTESSLLVRVASGEYTAVMRAKGDATGVALVEIYNLQ